MTFWAACGLLQKLGSSARLFSSAKRVAALSQSKMPPQQGKRLADGLGELLGFGAHGRLLGVRNFYRRYCDLCADIGGQPESVNAGGSWTVRWVERSADPAHGSKRVGAGVGTSPSLRAGGDPTYGRRALLWGGQSCLQYGAWWIRNPLRHARG